MVRSTGVLRWVRQLAVRSENASATDEELVHRFLTAQDATALELLIWRHERMVMGVCRRILRDAHDAEDAFQATFLTLARKAGVIRNGQAVAAWLYRVASRVSLTVLSRRRAARSTSLAPAVAESLPARTEHATEDRELRELLDRAVNRLPEAQRGLVVLCYFEGKTHEEAARLVGCAPGTVASRLARARATMRTWLARRGHALPLAAVAVALSDAGARAATANGLVTATVRAVTALVQGGELVENVSPAAVALSDGVVTALAWAKVKVLSAIVALLAVLGLGAGGLLIGQTPRDANPGRAVVEAPGGEQQPQRPRDRVGDLVKQLGSPKFAEREAAQQALLKLGPAIVPQLDRHRQGADLETQLRLDKIRYRLVGYADEILRFLERQSPVYEDKRIDVPENIKAVVAGHQPAAGDLLLTIIGNDRDKLHWPAVNLFAQTWNSHSAAQVETYLQKQFRFQVPHRPRYPAGVDAGIGLGYYLHYDAGSWPRGLTWQTRTAHYLDGQPYGKPYLRSGSDPGVTTGWIWTGKLAEGKHVFGMVVAYEFTHRGKKHQGTVRAPERMFEVTPANTSNELIAPADAETDKRVRQQLQILEHEPVPEISFRGEMPKSDPWQPQITWKTADGKGMGLSVPVWQVNEPLPVDLCFEVVFEDLSTGKRFQADPLILLKDKTRHRGYLTLRDVHGFASKRSGFVNVRVHLLPSRALALTEPAVTRYYPGTITVERRLKIMGPDEPAPKEGQVHP
ncbi:MAG TPA: RNA polymerase sigma factor [Gemmataceae bacterium]|nr:RNA polymerase sigma factor [Gemmataceae bacterium]